MNIHGERYANANLFVAYCMDLNVKTDERELEYYEKTGAMFPVARVVFPDEYVIQMRQHELDEDRDLGWLADWPDAIRLDDRVVLSPPQNEEPPEQVLVHRIDREIAAEDNPYLIRPNGTNFRQWGEYTARIADESGNELDLLTAEHYYSYWQVHQLYFIRKFSGLYQGPDPVEPLPKWLPEFAGKRQYFDALSLWITAYRRERERAFANIPPKNGIKKLKEEQAIDHRNRQIKLANEVMERFRLEPQDLYSFLYQLVEIHQEYVQDERYKLAGALEQDIFACELLLNLKTEETREQIANHLADNKQPFRHLSVATKERDYATRIINDGAQKCGHALQTLGCSNWTFTEEDANALLDYCQQEGLGLLSTALSGMEAVGYEELRQKSRRVLKYTNLKNILTAYEYLLKNLGEKGCQNVAGGLTGAVGTVMSNELWWTRHFEPRQKEGIQNGKNVDEFLNNLEKLLDDTDLKHGVEGFWARVFLVTCLARNMTVHSYPSDDRYYGDLFGPMLDSVIFATLHTWKLAQQKGWI